MLGRKTVKKLIVVFIAIFSISSYSSSITQTDWSGGWNEPGPVSSPGSSFDSSDSISWNSITGQISLSWRPNFFYSKPPIASDLSAALSVSASDINGDGYPDVTCCTGYPTQEINCWLNPCSLSSSWTFFLITVLPESYYVRDVIPSDIDSDGTIDLVITAETWEEDSVIWLGNSGDPATGWSVNFVGTLEYNPYISAVGDIDMDGDPDIAVVFEGYLSAHDSLCWFENRENVGSDWVHHGSWSCIYSMSSISFADINHDGCNDLLMSFDYPVNELAWFENANYGETWILHSIGNPYNEQDAVASDIDGDGWTDVCSSSYYGIRWHRNNNGSGTSWTTYALDDLYFSSINSADFDADGFQDIAVSTGWHENVSAIEGLWNKWNYYIGYSSDRISWSDLYNDGHIEILVNDEENIDYILFADYHRFSGSLTSSIIYTGDDPSWGAISWNAEEPLGTSIQFQVRASDDYVEMGEWSDAISSPSSLEGILNDYDSYFQYRALLATDDTISAPILHDVTIFWDPLQIEEGNEPEVSLRVQPNPAYVSAQITFNVPFVSKVTLAVFDITGRIVWFENLNITSSGSNSTVISGLGPGMYFLRLSAGGANSDARLVIIR